MRVEKEVRVEKYLIEQMESPHQMKATICHRLGEDIGKFLASEFYLNPDAITCHENKEFPYKYTQTYRCELHVFTQQELEQTVADAVREAFSQVSNPRFVDIEVNGNSVSIPLETGLLY